MQLGLLFKKELVENWRNKKWIWVPLVMIVLAAMDPLTNYYLPEIMDAVGGMPEGAVFEIPELSPAEVLMTSLGQLSSLGVLVIVLMAMGTIAGERKSGVLDLILVKPVSIKQLFLAKWASNLLLVWVSLFLALTMSWYYVNILFGHLSFTTLLLVYFYYGLWLTLIISIILFFNAFLKMPGMIAFCTILVSMLLSLATKIFGDYVKWSPVNLSPYIKQMMAEQEVGRDLLLTALVTIILSLLFVGCGVGIFQKNRQA